jgi:hypothetical protein
MQVRHAQGVHNVEGHKDVRAYLSPALLDAQLTPLGWSQVRFLVPFFVNWSPWISLNEQIMMIGSVTQLFSCGIFKFHWCWFLYAFVGRLPSRACDKMWTSKKDWVGYYFAFIEVSFSLTFDLFFLYIFQCSGSSSKHFNAREIVFSRCWSCIDAYCLRLSATNINCSPA